MALNKIPISSNSKGKGMVQSKQGRLKYHKFKETKGSRIQDSSV